jgi:hypothetical protein
MTWSCHGGGALLAHALLLSFLLTHSVMDSCTHTRGQLQRGSARRDGGCADGVASTSLKSGAQVHGSRDATASILNQRHPTLKWLDKKLDHSMARPMALRKKQTRLRIWMAAMTMIDTTQPNWTCKWELVWPEALVHFGGGW